MDWPDPGAGLYAWRKATQENVDRLEEILDRQQAQQEKLRKVVRMLVDQARPNRKPIREKAQS